jgi:hypothetical protein
VVDTGILHLTQGDVHIAGVKMGQTNLKPLLGGVAGAL